MHMLLFMMELARIVQAGHHFKVIDDKVAMNNEVINTYKLEPGWVFGEPGREMYHVAVRVSSQRLQIFPGQPHANYSYTVWHSPRQCVWFGSPLFINKEEENING